MQHRGASFLSSRRDRRATETTPLRLTKKSRGRTDAVRLSRRVCRRFGFRSFVRIASGVVEAIISAVCASEQSEQYYERRAERHQGPRYLPRPRDEDQDRSGRSGSAAAVAALDVDLVPRGRDGGESPRGARALHEDGDARLGTSSTAKSIDARLGVSAAASEFGSHVRGTVTVATLLKHANALDERLGVSDYSAEFARGFRSGAQDEDTVVAV